MKTKITLLLILISGFLVAQNGINYKAIIKDANGNVIANDVIQVQFTILQGAANVYQETHSPNTDANGIITVSIGEGTTSDVFTDINWSNDDHFLNIQVDIGTGLVDLGTTQFMSVPYALSSGDNHWSKNGNDIYTLTTEVGINSTSPEHTLDVRSNSQTEASGFNLSNTDKSRFVRFFSGSDMFPDPSMSWAPNHNFLFATFDDNTFDFQEKMRISSVGDVGIGITDPEAKLDILGGDWNLDAGNPGDLRIGNSTYNFRIGVATGGGDAGVTRMYTNSNNLILGTNNSPALTLTQSQTVGIGTTNPQHLFSIQSDVGSINAMSIESTNQPSGKDLVELRVPSGSDSSSQFIEMENGSSVVAAVNADGSAKFKSIEFGDNTLQTTAALKPVAYGAVNSNGTIASSGSGNFTVSYSNVSSFYTIVITDATSYQWYNLMPVISISGLFADVTISTWVNQNIIQIVFVPSANPQPGGGSMKQFTFIIYEL